MGTYRAVLVCVLLVESVCAQPAQKDHFKVEGVVVNSLTGKPLPRVLVQFNAHWLLTNREGEFSFDGVPPGRAYISLTKPGYFGPRESIRGRTSPEMVDVGPDTGKLVLTMAPEAVIFGRVTGRDEEPLEGATIQVLTRAAFEGRQTLTQTRGEVRTDEDGNFRIASLSAGRYYLLVKAGDVARRILGAQTPKAAEAYPAVVYYPGTQDLAAASPIEIVAGQKMEAQFSLALAPAYKLAGRVVAAGEWKHVHSPTIIDATEQPLFSPNQFDAASGAFEFRAIPEGVYTVRLSGSDPQDHQRSFDHTITVAKNASDVRLLLEPGASITVITHLEFNKPRPTGNCVWNQPGGQQKHSDCSDYPVAGVDLIAMDSIRTRVSSEYRPMDDPSRFVLQGVAPGKYMIRARPTVGGYVQSIRSGSADLLREVLTVPENGLVAPIEIVLRDDPGTLKVTVHAEKPGQPATILVFVDGELFPTLQSGGSSGSELYLPPVPPGNYKVLAFDNLDGVNYGDPEVLARYASKMASVTIASNGNASIVVDLIHVGD